MGIERSLVRILDVLLWVSHPAAGLSPQLAGWERYGASGWDPSDGFSGKAGSRKLKESRGLILTSRMCRTTRARKVEGIDMRTSFDPIVAVLRFAQRRTARVDSGSRQSAEVDLMRTNALRDSSEAQSAGVSLTLPRAVAAASA